MSVYVDDMRAPFRRMIMCHLVADTSDELHAMADRIGVDLRWVQYPGTYKEHYDICLSMRAKAVRAGASEITWRECGIMVEKRDRTRPPVARGSPDHGKD